jgi:HNH endonuclease
VITEDVRRFLSKIYRDLAGCWIWKGSKRAWRREPNDGGYGAFWQAGKVHRAHKWIYEQLVGRVPRGKVLRHTCDTRSCVNIWHMHPGTQKQNVRDMLAKGREASRAM